MGGELSTGMVKTTWLTFGERIDPLIVERTFDLAINCVIMYTGCGSKEGWMFSIAAVVSGIV